MRGGRAGQCPQQSFTTSAMVPKKHGCVWAVMPPLYLAHDTCNAAGAGERAKLAPHEVVAMVGAAGVCVCACV